jgi:molybdenum cofactor cytidylyltransferase
MPEAAVGHNHARRPCALLLAAGAARRFGADKLSVRLLDGTPVGVAAARSLLAAGCETLAVVRDAQTGITPELARLGVRLALCPEAHLGMGHSLACGVQASADADGWLVALADMPWVQPASIAAVAAALAAGAHIAAPQYAGRRGHPVGFAAGFRAQLLALGGDQGARGLLRAHADRIVTIDVDDPGVLRDVDLPADLRTDSG